VDGIVYVGTVSGKVHAIDAATGEDLWTARDYWPVIHEGRVVIRTAEAGARILSGRVGLLQKGLFWPVSYNPADLANQQVHFKAKSGDDKIQEQDLFVEFYQQFPMVRTFLVLNLSDGTEPYTASVVAGCRNTGTPPPPVVAGEGNLYTTFRTSAAFRGLMDITDCGLGCFHLDTGKVAQPLACGQDEVGNVIGARSPFELTSDETVTLLSGGNLVFGFRCDAAGGVIDLGTRRGTTLPDVELPKSSDMLPSGNVLTISRQWILYTNRDPDFDVAPGFQNSPPVYGIVPFY